MKWKKILSFAIVSVLVFSVLVSFVGGLPTATAQGERPEELYFDVTLSMETGAARAADPDDIHMFMQNVDGPTYTGLDDATLEALETWECFGSYNSWLLNPAHEGHGTVEALDAEDAGWIDSVEDLRYLAHANNDYNDGEWTVNPLSNTNIRFAFQYSNREDIIESILEGFGNPRYGAMDAETETWEEYFEDRIEGEYGLTPEGDEDAVEWLVEHGMQEIIDHVAEHPGMGEVYGSIEDGWYYDHPEQDEHQIHLRIYARIEDYREDWGEWTVDFLEDLGFSAENVPVDSASAIPQAFFGSPEPYDNLEYHIYTGGWISTMTIAFQELGVNQMHLPWVGFMQSWNTEDRYNYAGDQEPGEYLLGPSDEARAELGLPDRPDGLQNLKEANEYGQRLYAGQFEDMDRYWEMKGNVIAAGVEEAVRVFSMTETGFYPYNPDQILQIVPDSVNGYDTFMGLRTVLTNDGEFETLILTGEDRPYMDNWNIHGGSADVYGEYQRRAVREYGSWMHPRSGRPYQVGTYWESGELSNPERTDPYERQGSVELDYEWVEDEEGELELVENIEIPSTAVDYVPGENAWLTIDDLQDLDPAEHPYTAQEDDMAAVKIELDIHDEYVWHDGTEVTLQDFMFWYARVKELGSPDGEDPYYGRTEGANAAWWGSIHATEWDFDNGIVTMYGDYAFPAEDKVGNYYSFFPETHPLTYYGFDLMHATDDYSYDGAVGDWIHQLSSTHSDDMVTTLQGVDEVPIFATEAGNAPIVMEMSEWEDRVDNIADFVNTYEHSFIGCGPYMLTEYDEDEHDMTMEMFEDYGFALPGEEVGGITFANGYWYEQFVVEGLTLESISAPDSVDVGEDISVTVDAIWEQEFPEELVRAVTEDDLVWYDLRLRDEDGDVVVEIGEEDIELDPQEGFTEITGDIPTEGVDPGSYEIQFRAQSVGAVEPDTISTDVEVTFAVDAWELTVEVIGDGSVEVEYIEDGDEEEATVGAGEEDTFFVDPGTEVTLTAVEDEDFIEWSGDIGDEDPESLEITIEMDEDKSVTAEFEEEEVDTPGFTLALLVLGAVIAVAIYAKKER